MAGATDVQWMPKYNPWLIATAVMLATFMEVMDTSIAAVALPYIAGSVSATSDEATWVLTSYLVANAIFIPMSTWLSLKFGRKRYLITSVLIFTAASFACGSANSLAFILIARAIQGAAGGALQPLALASLRREATFAYFRTSFAWYACAFLFMLVLAMGLAIQANFASPPRMAGGSALTLVGAFILFNLLWVLSLFRRFSSPR